MDTVRGKAAHVKREDGKVKYKFKHLTDDFFSDSALIVKTSKSSC